MSPLIPIERTAAGLGAQFYSMLTAQPPVVEIDDGDLPKGWYYARWDDVTPKLASDFFRNKFGRMPPVVYMTTTKSLGKQERWTRKAWIPHSPVPGELPDDLFLVAPDQTS